MTTKTDPRPSRARVREGEELWETTTDGAIWYVITDQRGREKHKRVGGKAGTRIRITTADRELNQDNIIDPDKDPWHNGFLKRVDKDQSEDEATATDQALSTEELMALFAKNGNAFQSAVRGLNERNCRRMLAIAEDVDASVAQVNFLQEHVTSTYRVQGSMPSHDQMVSDGWLSNNSS